jgi:alpha-amylase
LRQGEALDVELRDLDGDGAAEVWVHSATVSAVVRPSRGGALVELTDLRSGVNLANVLTRRRESYHRVTAGAAHAPHATEEGAMPSIHEIEEGLKVDELPPVDLDVRALLVDRVVADTLTVEAYARADYTPLHTWSRDAFHVDTSIVRAPGGDVVTVALASGGVIALEKTLAFEDGGDVTVTYRWDPAGLPADAWFAPELSLEHDPGLAFEPAPADVWRHDIVTMSKRESGLEQTVQGVSVTPLWPTALGSARIVIPMGTGKRA